MRGRANLAQRRIAGRMPLGGFAQHDSAGRLAVAALAVPAGLAGSDRPLGIAAHGYGPGGEALAAHLVERAAAWDSLGRPGAGNLELAAYPGGLRPEAEEGAMIIRRPNNVLVAGWPAAA